LTIEEARRTIRHASPISQVTCSSGLTSFSNRLLG
jgi:hypothetical protein